MPNDECRLTYSEGNEIRRNAEKPYVKAEILFLLMGLVCIGALGCSELLDEHFHIHNHDELDDLLDSGTVPPELHEYLLHKEREQFLLLPAAFIINLIISALTLSVMGEIEAKKALKEANRKRGDADE